MSLPESHYRKVPISELRDPSRGTFDVYVNYWWAVTEDKCLLFYTRGIRRYYGSPQCNESRDIAERVSNHVDYPWKTRVEQVPVVYVPHRCDP